MRGRIKKALSGFYYVDTGEEVVTCRARGRFRKEGVSPLVGDRVEIWDKNNWAEANTYDDMDEIAANMEGLGI